MKPLNSRVWGGEHLRVAVGNLTQGLVDPAVGARGGDGLAGTDGSRVRLVQVVREGCETRSQEADVKDVLLHRPFLRPMVTGLLRAGQQAASLTPSAVMLVADVKDVERA